MTSGWHEGRDYEAKFEHGWVIEKGEQELYAERQRRKQAELALEASIRVAEDTEKQRLFAQEQISELQGCIDVMTTEFEAHDKTNQQLLAERQRRKQAERIQHAEKQILLGEIAKNKTLTEGLLSAQTAIEKLEGALHHPSDPNHTCQFKLQLMSALVAIEDARKGITKNPEAAHRALMNIDLSLLHQHDAKMLNPLVDLILECREAVAFLSDKVAYDEIVTPTRHTTSSLCKAVDDTLAKVKEQ